MHASRTSLVYTGIWAEALSESELTLRRRAARSQLGIPQDAIVVGAVCNLQEWKGLHILLEAYARLAEQTSGGVYFVHVGGHAPGYEGYEQFVLQRARELRIEGQCTFLGFQSDPGHYYPAFDVFAHVPIFEQGGQHSEAFGQVIPEAMAHHLPVVAARIGGIPEIVVHGQTGLLVESEDAEGTSQALGRLVSDPGERRRMAQNGFRRYQEHFTIEREVDDYEAIFRDLSGSGAAVGR